MFLGFQSVKGSDARLEDLGALYRHREREAHPRVPPCASRRNPAQLGEGRSHSRRTTRFSSARSSPRAALSLSSRSLLSRTLWNVIECPEFPKCQYIYSGQLLRNCTRKPLRVFAFINCSLILFFSVLPSLVPPAFSSQPSCFLNLCSGPWRYFPALLKGASQSLQIFSGSGEGATWSLPLPELV